MALRCCRRLCGRCHAVPSWRCTWWRGAFRALGCQSWSKLEPVGRGRWHDGIDLVYVFLMYELYWTNFSLLCSKVFAVASCCSKDVAGRLEEICWIPLAPPCAWRCCGGAAPHGRGRIKGAIGGMRSSWEWRKSERGQGIQNGCFVILQFQRDFKGILTPRWPLKLWTW